VSSLVEPKRNDMRGHHYSVLHRTESVMKQNMKNFTVAASTFVVAALFSVGWSEQSGVSLSVEKAEARVGRPLTPVSVAGVARRHYRRAAIGTAAAVGATAWGAGYYGGGPSYGGAVRDAHAAYYGGSPYTSGTPVSTHPHYAVTASPQDGPWYGYSGWDDYAARNGIRCTPGTMVQLDDGLMHVCQ
jgi:hypothetical protein